MALRYKSTATFLEYPVIAIAVGPDPANYEIRGHGRGLIALADIATGVIARGFARGVIAIGGLAIGVLTLGGLGLGLVACGGLAVGYLAAGGLAVGYAAIGGLAIGHYAMGGSTLGKYLIGPLRQDREAVEFFSTLANGILKFFVPKSPPRSGGVPACCPSRFRLESKCVGQSSRVRRGLRP